MKKIPPDLSTDLLDDATRVTGRGITEANPEELQLVRQGRAYQKAMALKGKLRLDINLDELRLRSGETAETPSTGQP